MDKFINENAFEFNEANIELKAGRFKLYITLKRPRGNWAEAILKRSEKPSDRFDDEPKSITELLDEHK